MIRLVVATVVALVAGAATAGPAAALPILEEGDAIELANKLAEAMDEQDICYGWVVNISGEVGGTFNSPDQGSSLGPDRDPFDAACTPSVVFVADLLYTSELSEASDSADFRVETTLPLTISDSELARFGVTDAALLGENDDLALTNAVSALPALVAEAGLAPPVPIEPSTGSTPNGDRPTGGAGSDRLRTYWPLYLVAALVALAGVAWLLGALVLRSNDRRQALPARAGFTTSEEEDP